MEKIFNKLFDEHIEQGLIIRTNRIAGKTSFMLKKANELARSGKKVLIVTHSFNQRENLVRQNIDRFRRQHENILFSCNGARVLSEWDYKDRYTFYDEPWLYSNFTIEQVPRVMYIGTDNTNTFTVNNYEYYPKGHLEKLKSYSEELFKQEYESNVFTHEDIKNELDEMIENFDKIDKVIQAKVEW